MKVITVDFETYYDDNYSLKKMTPVEYILDPRFEAIGCAVKELGKPAVWVDGPDLPAFFASLDPKDTTLISHNSLFDMCIAVWRYGFTPRLMVDTLGVSRALLGYTLRSLSLESVAKHLGLGAKGTAIRSVKGMNAAMIKAAGLWDEFVAYALNDAALAEGIFEQLVMSGAFPMNELIVQDMVLRMATHPSFRLNKALLAEHLREVELKKDTMLQVAVSHGATKHTLASNEQFAELLWARGVEPPTKTSPVTGKVTYAFAKTDVEFLKLQDHPDPAVQALVAARLGAKSTLEESRTKRLLTIADLEWPGRGRCALMPMPVKYSGAHTHRLSGDWNLNVQNFTRGSKLRLSLEAPDGYEVVTVDAAQIEARLVAVLCQVDDLIRQFRDDEDVYSNFASTVFGFPVNKKDHPTQRFVGKQAVLGLGFGLGWANFQRRLKTDSLNQTGRMIELSDDEAQNVVNTYRTTFYGVPNTWKMLQEVGIPVLANGGSFSLGPCHFEKNAILLPSGLRLHYHGLHYDTTVREWVFTYGGVPKRIYGGKVLENIVQALDRCIVMDAAVRIKQRCAALNLAQQAHDENGYVVPKELVPLAKQILEEEMTRPPAYLPNIPLKAEVGVGPSYGAAK